MKKIQIFAREVGYTGFAKEIVMLINSLVNLYQIEVVFINDSNTTPYNLAKKVKVKYINVGINFLLNKKLRKSIDEYQANIIISTDEMFNKLIIKYKDKADLIYWNHQFNLEEFNARGLEKFNSVVFASRKIFDAYSGNNKVYIPDGIMIENKNANKLNTKNLVFIGKLNKNKNLDQLLEVMSVVRSKDKEINLAIIGDGEEHANLVMLAKKLRLGLSVTFFGALSDEEKKDILIDTSLCVSTSNSSSFGVSFLELMSYGVPVVAYQSAINSDEIIKDELNGYVIENGNIKQMAEKILYLINNQSILDEMGLTAFETAVIYDINNIKNEWIKILK